MKIYKLPLLVFFGIFAFLFVLGWASQGRTVRSFGSTGIYKADFLVTRVISRKREIYKDYQWRLDIPREYLVRYSGINGRSNYSPSKGYSESYNVTLVGSVDLNEETIEPYKASPASNKSKVRITLQNASSNKYLPNADYCLTREEWRQAVLGSTSRLKDCDLSRPGLCEIYMPMGGWKVSIAVDKSRYPEPQISCEIVRKFLNEHTISRDSLADK